MDIVYHYSKAFPWSFWRAGLRRGMLHERRVLLKTTAAFSDAMAEAPAHTTWAFSPDQLDELTQAQAFWRALQTAQVAVVPWATARALSLRDGAHAMAARGLLTPEILEGVEAHMRWIDACIQQDKPCWMKDEQDLELLLTEAGEDLLDLELPSQPPFKALLCFYALPCWMPPRGMDALRADFEERSGQCFVAADLPEHAIAWLAAEVKLPVERLDIEAWCGGIGFCALLEPDEGEPCVREIYRVAYRVRDAEAAEGEGFLGFLEGGSSAYWMPVVWTPSRGWLSPFYVGLATLRELLKPLATQVRAGGVKRLGCVPPGKRAQAGQPEAFYLLEHRPWTPPVLPRPAPEPSPVVAQESSADEPTEGREPRPGSSPSYRFDVRGHDRLYRRVGTVQDALKGIPERLERRGWTLLLEGPVPEDSPFRRALERRGLPLTVPAGEWWALRLADVPPHQRGPDGHYVPSMRLLAPSDER